MNNMLLNKELDSQLNIGLLANLLIKNGYLIVTAESCTGGMIAAACTDLAGSSAWFERGFVTYSNAAKTQALGVSASLIATEGAVSQAVVCAMAQGALSHSKAQVAVAVTGVAGPTGGSALKPVGTVWFGFAVPGLDHVMSEVQCFNGDRAAVRLATVHHAVNRLIELLSLKESPASVPAP